MSAMVKGAINNALLSLLARPQFRRINTYMRTVANRGLGIGHYGALRSAAEEYLVKSVLAKRPQGCVIDVGANEGNFSSFVRRSSDLPIFAYEPHPETYRRVKLVAERQGFTVANLALGDEAGAARLFDRSEWGCSTGQATLHADVITQLHHGEAASFEVRVDTLDNIDARSSFPSVALLKIDTEGHELAVLRGGRKLLRSGRVQTILFEFNSMNLISRTTLRDFYDALPGYDLYRVLPAALLPLGEYDHHNEVFDYQNIVAHRRA